MPNDDNSPPTQVNEEEYVDEKSNETIRRFLGEAVDSMETGETKTTEDVSEKQAVVEKKVSEAKEPDIDVEAETTKIKRDIVKRISDSLGLTEEEKQQAEDEGITAPWAKEKRTPKSYEEVAEFASDLAEFKRKKAEAQKQKDQEAKVEADKRNQQRINELWDIQLDEMRKANLIPDIDEKVREKMKSGVALSQEDLQDPGIIAQRDLFNTMGEVAQKRRAEKLPVITNLKEIYYEHYKAKQARAKQPAGADAPVSGGRPGVSQDDSQFKYADIKGKSYYELLNEG